ncbi:MAG: LysM domain-containing protein [Polyangiaceae bacterium]
MIDKTSRYAKIETVTAKDAQGEEVTLLSLREIPLTTGVFYHTPQDGERLDHLGQQYFRDSKKFWRICDASDVLDPFDVLVAGRPVLIPPSR